LGCSFCSRLFVLKTSVGQTLFKRLGDGITRLLGFADQGSSFVFGTIYTILAIKIAATIIFVAALFAILYYLGVMQLVVRGLCVGMSKAMGASGAESLNVAASIFMGQTEAPLTIRPYLPRDDAVRADDGDDVGHGAHLRRHHGGVHRVSASKPKQLLTAVIMTAPGTLMMAKVFVPETAQAGDLGTVRLELPKTDVNIIDAAGRGTRRRVAPRAERPGHARVIHCPDRVVKRPARYGWRPGSAIPASACK
jgi:CNT family concentrative nucleoside transporter